MTVPIHKRNEQTNKIEMICQLLEDEMIKQPDLSRENIAMMYFLAAEFITSEKSHLFRIEMKVEESLLFQLSGFKKPLSELVELSRLNDADKGYETQLLMLKEYFLKRHQQIMAPPKKQSPKIFR